MDMEGPGKACPPLCVLGNKSLQSPALIRGIEAAIEGSGGLLAPLKLAAFRHLFRTSLTRHLAQGSYSDFLDEARGEGRGGGACVSGTALPQ